MIKLLGCHFNKYFPDDSSILFELKQRNFLFKFYQNNDLIV